MILHLQPLQATLRPILQRTGPSATTLSCVIDQCPDNPDHLFSHHIVWSKLWTLFELPAMHYFFTSPIAFVSPPSPEDVRSNLQQIQLQEQKDLAQQNRIDQLSQEAEKTRLFVQDVSKTSFCQTCTHHHFH